MRHIHFCLAGLVLPLAVLACSAPAHEPSEHARAPLSDPNVLFERGRVYADAGDYTRAEQYFAAALAVGGKSSVCLRPLVKACVAAGHLRLASEYVEAELARAPNDASLRFLAGALHASIGDRVAAQAHLVQAARDLPRDADVQFAVATFFRDQLQDRIGADPYFRDYLRLAPSGEHRDEAKASLMERVQ